ncbi:protein tramtrack, beta isoform isoform X6 [Cydia splendana]|uniref:protein tramtrack, beta isoform isoform X6 n=1 Tax=Cydia splendana TaxID=1100963 RepID=UPI00300D6BFC
MASDEQFSLCWNNFHANMSAGFHGLLSRGDLVDVTLAAEGRLLQAHKLVLSVCSPYFQEMFKMNPTQHPIVFLKDVSHSALRDLLQFMYQGEVNVKQEELASFISTAEQLQVKGLTGNQNEESSTPSKPKPTSRPGPRSSQQRQSVMTKLETDLDSKPSSTPVAIKRPNRPSIASNNSSSSQSGPVKRKCVDPLEAGPSGSAKEEFVTIPDEDENNAVAPKMEPEFVNESMWDDDDDGTNNDETNFGEDDSNMEMTGFDGSTTGDGNLTGGAEGGAVGDAQEVVSWRACWLVARCRSTALKHAPACRLSVRSRRCDCQLSKLANGLGKDMFENKTGPLPDHGARRAAAVLRGQHLLHQLQPAAQQHAPAVVLLLSQVPQLPRLRAHHEQHRARPGAHTHTPSQNIQHILRRQRILLSC